MRIIDITISFDVIMNVVKLEIYWIYKDVIPQVLN